MKYVTFYFALIIAIAFGWGAWMAISREFPGNGAKTTILKIVLVIAFLIVLWWVQPFIKHGLLF